MQHGEINYKEKLNALFEKLKIKAEVSSYFAEGPFVVFDVILTGSRYNKLELHNMEIALALQSVAPPLIYPVTKEGVVRIEIMLNEPGPVSWKEVVSSEDFKRKTLPLALGKRRNGDVVVPELRKLPHVLLGGSTGSGKSVMLHSIINGLLLKDYVKFAMIDTKRVELSCYSKLNNLYAPIAHDVESAVKLLDSLVKEMEKRFIKLKAAGCRDIYTYPKNMPYIVLVIDEFADLMLFNKKVVQNLICRLAQKSRACGIHLVVATQRPSVDVVTGLIKANFPARISCRVSSAVDSRVLLDKNGAEKLLGCGDAIVDSAETGFQRFKGAFLREKDINNLIAQKAKWWHKILK